MQKLADKNLDFMLETMREIMAIDSPSGFCDAAAQKAVSILDKLGHKAVLTNKGAVVVEIKGESSEKKVGITAHLDTLGAAVRSVTGSGGIRFVTIGGLQLPTVDGEYCKIHTRSGKVFGGTFLSTSPASHVFSDANTATRDAKHMYIRLDERVKNAADVKALGIETGDIITLDPKFVVTDSGFVKSRFLDDKASVAVVLTALYSLKNQNKKPKFDTKIIFTVHEEVGHGGAAFGQDLSEIVAVDMGCIGDDLTCTEYDVSICAQDSSGPYDYHLTGRLIELAKKHSLNYAVDIYPFYGSDVSAMRRAGADVRGALIGPGVHASHGMERTHSQGLVNSLKLLEAYLTE